jgi:hypothetical protein
MVNEARTKEGQGLARCPLPNPGHKQGKVVVGNVAYLGVAVLFHRSEPSQNGGPKQTSHLVALYDRQY